MHPILLKLGNFTIYSYGLFYGLSFLAAILYLVNRSKKSKEKALSHDEIYSLFLYAILLGVLGARIFYVLTNLGEFAAFPIDILKIWNGGLVYYGGFIFVAIFIILYAKKKKISLLKLGDFVAPSVALGHAIGRIGCFFAGCCYGRETNVPWSVIFKDRNSLAVLGVHLHPAQLYESFGNFLIFLVLYFYSKKKPKEGQIVAVYFMSYAVLRFTVEFFRGDSDRGAQCFGLSVSQVMSVLLFIIGVFIVCKKK
ncbi:MAG: prolipoprotein diacylglyceryl transferase [Endomicrobium sp.]|jgi:phosphatidylglycerol:prolipoprotein diacylglycerol transferase|nr:prolipoprotein diacylglyceryl transferase [Endomicrobium sp.]